MPYPPASKSRFQRKHLLHHARGYGELSLRHGMMRGKTEEIAYHSWLELASTQFVALCRGEWKRTLLWMMWTINLLINAVYMVMTFATCNKLVNVSWLSGRAGRGWSRWPGWECLAVLAMGAWVVWG